MYKILTKKGEIVRCKLNLKFLQIYEVRIAQNMSLVNVIGYGFTMILTLLLIEPNIYIIYIMLIYFRHKQINLTVIGL